MFLQLKSRSKVIILFFSFFIFHFFYSYGQEKALYLKFEENSEDFYLKEGEFGNKIREKVYWKSKQNNGDIRFYIKGLAFVYKKSKMQEKIVDCSTIQSKDILSADEVEKHIKFIQEKYPLGYKYPSKEYPMLFVVCKDQKVRLYEVKWEYYIE